MKKNLVIIAGMLVILLLSVTACTGGSSSRSNPLSQLPPPVFAADTSGQSGFIWSQQNVGLWVNGDGKVNAVPDIALLSLGVESQQKSVAEAQKLANEAMAKLMKVLKDKGIADKDIQTQNFNINQVTQWSDKDRQSIVLGYRVSNTVIAKIRKISDAGTIIDAAAEVAGNAVRVNSISFTIDDPTPYYTQAREKAVKYAMEKAKQLSTAAGFKLGKLLYVSEGSSYYTPTVRNVYNKAGMDMAAPAPEPTSISAGELEIQASIQMVFNID
jgi:uncharacterized protein